MFDLFDYIFAFWSSIIYPSTFFSDMFLPLEEGVELNVWLYDWERNIFIYAGQDCSVADILVYLLSFISLLSIFYLIYKIIKLIICRISGC